MSITIKLRRGNATDWTSQNIVLASGEPGYEIDTGRFKIGDGSTAWTTLDYASVIPTGLLAGSGINIDLGTNGSTATINVSGLNSSYISDFNEAVDDRVGSGLFSAGTGINLNYDDAGNSFTVSVTGLISNPADNRILTSRDSTTTGIDAESNLTFDGSLLGVSGDLIAGTGNFHILQFNTDNGLVDTQGQIGWNDTEGTVDVALTDTAIVHVGEHTLYRIRNTTGDVLYKGQAVYASGIHSNGIITPDLYVADGSIREIRFMGLVFEDVNDNNNGYAINFGHIYNIDTRGNVATDYAVGDETWFDGDILYVHPTVAGKLTKVEPKHSISVAIILDAASNGKIFVRPTSYGHLDDNHDVNVSGVTNGQFLQYDSSTDYWVPSSSGDFTELTINNNQIITGTGIVNHIPYWNTSSEILADSGELYWDNVNNRLGIGTNAPSYQLEVQGSGYFANNLDVAGSTLRLYDTGASSWKPIYANGNNLTFTGVHGIFEYSLGLRGSRGSALGLESNATNGYLAIAAGGSEKVRIATDGKVGVQTTTPSYDLDVNGSGNFSDSLNVDNLRLDGNTLSATNTNGNIIVETNGTGALQRDSGGNTRGQYSVDLQNVRSTNTQVAAGNYSVIGGGRNNTASNSYSTVSGGRTNNASGSYSTVGGGFSNNVSGSSNTVSGGRSNTASSSYSTVGGGFSNNASSYSTVSGGGNNNASGSYSTVGGGISNTASSYSTVSGGRSNNASSTYSTVGGGRNNTASNVSTVVGGGYANQATNTYSVVAGGSTNTSSGYYSTVSGGLYNTANGARSVVGGGYNNTASTYYSTVGGGGSNNSGSNGATIAGGKSNTASAYYASIGGGLGNSISSGGYIVIGGGRSNVGTGNYSTVSGGYHAKASRWGEVSHAAGRFASAGDAQHTVLVARRTTADATANQVLFLNGSSQRLTIPTQTMWTFEVKLSAYNDTDHEGAWWIIRGGIINNNAGDVALVGSLITENGADTSLSTASASVVADDTNDALEIRVTGVAGKDIRWVAVVDISQVSYGTP